MNIFRIFRKTLILNKLESFTKDRKFSSKVGILGAPFSKGQPISGVDLAPDVFRNFGLMEDLKKSGVDVKDYGNLEFDLEVDETPSGKLKFPATVGAACQKVSTAVKEVLSDKRLCLTLGGDHSLSVGTIYGHSLVHDLCVLWIDAHSDINTAESTCSGNMHGMPCSFFVEGIRDEKFVIPGFEWMKPCVKKSNIAFIGLRDIDPCEKLILSREKILHFTMRDIDELGIFEVINRALEAINPERKLSLHVSFDIDSVDKLSSPSTGTPVLGGLTIREALCLAEEISKLDHLNAVDIMEVNPTLGSTEQIETTLTVAKLVVKAFLGHSRSGTLPADKEIQNAN